MLIVATAVLVSAASVFRSEVLDILPTAMLPISAREQYVLALRLAGIADTPAGRNWLAGATAQRWDVPVRRGQRIVIDAPGAAGVFIDLVDLETFHTLASTAPGSTHLAYVATSDHPVAARVQPPIGGVLPATVERRVEPSLTFPIQGMTGRAAHASFGAPRDAGRRRHEGIDLFAARGTPVVAAADGWVTRQTSNRLGGNVVWVWSPSLRISTYYAHLERQAVGPGNRVHAGDVIGYVGNTGNARGTAPHLHFGVYAMLDGAIDPFPFVHEPALAPR